MSRIEAIERFRSAFEMHRRACINIAKRVAEEKVSLWTLETIKLNICEGLMSAATDEDLDAEDIRDMVRAVRDLFDEVESIGDDE